MIKDLEKEGRDGAIQEVEERPRGGGGLPLISGMENTGGSNAEQEEEGLSQSEWAPAGPASCHQRRQN